MSQPSLCIIYAYYEKGEQYRTNLIYFLKHGYCKDPLIDYIFVVNGSHTVKFPSEYNIRVIQRENTGFDFQGYYTGIISLKKRYDYYMFMNATSRGPYLPPYTASYVKWYQPFIDLLKSDPNIKLVGSTINVQPPSERLHLERHYPHVQSNCFVMDGTCLDYLTTTSLFEKYYSDKYDVIEFQEIGMSTLVLKHGWNISCLVPEYQKIDYRDPSMNNKIVGDVLWTKNELGRTIHPYEVIFLKTERGISTNEIETLTNHQLNMNEMYFKNDPSHTVAICFHLGYSHMFPLFNKYIRNVFHSGYNVDLYVTYQKKTDPIHLISQQYPNTVFIQTTHGCDTGAFLLQLEYIYQKCPLKYEYIFKIHTKKREDWRLELLEPIADSVNNIQKVYDLFKTDNQVGMISGAPGWIRSHDKINEPIIKDVCRQLRVKIDSHSKFVGGTIFWVRWSIVKKFIEASGIDFKKEYERCELGYLLNNKPTYTHTWERIFGYIVNNFGAKLVSINNYQMSPTSHSVRDRGRCIVNRVCYGISTQESLDVTEMIKNKAPFNFRLINMNEEWGDPYNGKVKTIFVNFSNGQVCVLNEFAGRVNPNNFVISCENGELIWHLEDNDNIDNYITIKSHEKFGQVVTTFFDWSYYYQKYTPWLTAKTYNECLQHYIKYGFDSNLSTFETGSDLLKKYQIQLIAMYIPYQRTETLKTWKPMYKGHQIKKPDNNTPTQVDLVLLKKHINQARNCGINGFCMVHKWDQQTDACYINFEQLLLSNTSVLNFPYCFSWMTATTETDCQRWVEHFNYLLPFFKDSHYIRVNQQPVFLISSVAKTEPFIVYWNQMAINNGLKGVFFIDTVDNPQASASNNLCHCTTHVNPKYGHKMYPQYFQPKRNYLAMDYQRLCRSLINQKKPSLVHFRDVFVGFDNTPNPDEKNKIICEKVSFKSFYCHLKAQLEKVLENPNQNLENFIFLHSWNDWENQMVIESDTQMLNVINNVVAQYKNPQIYNKTPDLIL